MEGDGYNFRQLKSYIMALSRAAEWEVAKKEWKLVSVYDSDEPDTCPCGHFPIIEICEIHNRVTGHRTEVGNVCVRRFLGVRSDKIFAALKRIRHDPTKSLNADAIVFFGERKILSNWEYKFLQNTMKRRSLSPAQIEKRK